MFRISDTIALFIVIFIVIFLLIESIIYKKKYLNSSRILTNYLLNNKKELKYIAHTIYNCKNEIEKIKKIRKIYNLDILNAKKIINKIYEIKDDK
ncbi:hypothetical protein [Gemella sp. zg-1178]|uniref:hypothetical protein n=1 Tax=Gemella sp. zg-1178 TaxID=2840372 RepID=UPI001C052FBE|nr:hypothetical protein [Gemella sp. zg-1178]MBU0278145.1 hypothetical protein [Gemella sp. zg-1178]